jgi:hypothetical protein
VPDALRLDHVLDPRFAGLPERVLVLPDVVLGEAIDVVLSAVAGARGGAAVPSAL